MRQLLLCASVAASLAIASPAFADGPFEPNETPDEAVTPLSGGQLTAGFETPQDQDWYRLYALTHRQIGVLLTLQAPCTASYGAIGLDLVDGDAPYGKLIATFRVGQSGFGPTVLSQRTAFTSQRGHRYFLHVTQSSCVGSTYTLDVAPAQNLTQTLVDTQPCVDANGKAKQDYRRWQKLKKAVRRAHGAKRRTLRTRAALQRQQAAQSRDAAKVSCTRPPLTGYPFT